MPRDLLKRIGLNIHTVFTTRLSYPSLSTPLELTVPKLVRWWAGRSHQIQQQPAGGGLGLLNVTNYFSAQNQIVLVKFGPNVNDGQDGILNLLLLFCFQHQTLISSCCFASNTNRAYHVTRGTEPRKTIVVLVLFLRPIGKWWKIQLNLRILAFFW